MMMASKILVVDDEPDLELLISQRFRRDIRDGTFIFRFARDGQEALDNLQAEPDIELVLSDINMPGIDGLVLMVSASRSQRSRTEFCEADDAAGEEVTSCMRATFC